MGTVFLASKFRLVLREKKWHSTASQCKGFKLLELAVSPRSSWTYIRVMRAIRSRQVFCSWKVLYHTKAGIWSQAGRVSVPLNPVTLTEYFLSDSSLSFLQVRLFKLNLWGTRSTPLVFSSLRHFNGSFTRHLWILWGAETSGSHLTQSRGAEKNVLLW